MASDETLPVKGDGLSALAVEKTDAVHELLTRKDFLESAQELAKKYFDKAWSIDPDSETEIGPTPRDVAARPNKTIL